MHWAGVPPQGPRRIPAKLADWIGPEGRPPVISRVEVLNYRCLRFIQRPLDAMHILVGPNASGKTTFLKRFRANSPNR